MNLNRLKHSFTLNPPPYPLLKYDICHFIISLLYLFSIQNQEHLISLHVVGPPKNIKGRQTAAIGNLCKCSYVVDLFHRSGPPTNHRKPLTPPTSLSKRILCFTAFSLLDKGV